jgi:soluble lytic murein transglycosylase-like protein
MPKDKLDPLVNGAAKSEGVDPQLVQAVIDQESASKPCAVSVKGAQGLMQLMPATAAELGVKDAFDAKQNVEAGTRFLKQLLTKYNGDVSLALGAYNAGAGRVDHDGGIPEIPETINYVKDILAKVPTQQ